MLLLTRSALSPSCSAAAQNPEAAQGGVGQKAGKDSASRRKEEAKHAAKKPKEKVDALSQFDLNNYASEWPESNDTVPSI